ncbi:MAG: hypothetical protein P8Y62_05440 [candidate division WOR-3 bacterium]
MTSSKDRARLAHGTEELHALEPIPRDEVSEAFFLSSTSSLLR